MVVEVASGVAFTLLVVLLVLFTSIMLRSWRWELAVQMATGARRDRLHMALQERLRRR